MINTDTVAVDRSDFGTFIHSELDDAGLSVHAFRIYCHLARRANLNGKAWPGAMSMARVTTMSERQVRYAIAELEARGMITVIRSGGGRASNHYYLNSKKVWTPADPCTRCTPAGGAPLPCTTCTPPLQEVPPTPAGGATEGIPIRRSKEGNPIRQSSAPPAEPATLELFEKTEIDSAGQAETLYQAYPRHVGRPDAIKKIRAALKKAPFDTLLKAVEAFAATTSGKEAQYIPHPATWFHQERYNDTTETTNTTKSQNESRAAAAKLW